MSEEGLTKLEKLRRRSQMYKKLRQDLEKQRIEKMKNSILNKDSKSKSVKVNGNNKKTKVDSKTKSNPKEEVSNKTDKSKK